MSQPEFLSSINARMALESPQVVASWEFADTVSPLDSTVPWLWEEMRLRRSVYRYPESISEGDSLLTEAYSTSPSTSKADTGVADDLTYYYSLFFQYKELNTSGYLGTFDIRRLFTQLRGLDFQMPVVKSDYLDTLADGVLNAGDPTFTSALSTFITDGVCAGDAIEIDGDNYIVLEVTSETSLEVTPTPTGSGTGVDRIVWSAEQRYVLSGTTHERREMCFTYNTRTGYVDRAIDFTVLMAEGEYLIYAMPFPTNNDEDLYVVTNLRSLKFHQDDGYVTDNPTESDIVGQYSFVDPATPSSQLPGGYEISGVTLYFGGKTPDLYILDRANKKVYRYGSGVMDSIDLSLLEHTDDLRGLSYDYINMALLVGNANVIYTLLVGSNPLTIADVAGVTYTRDRIDADLAWDFIVAMYLMTWQVVTACNSRGSMDQYRPSTGIGLGYLWQQPPVAEALSVALYHMDEAAPLADASQYANALVNSGMTHRDAGRFTGGCYQAQADDVYLSADISSVGTSGIQGTFSVWFKAAEVSVFSTAPGIFVWCPEDVNNGFYLGIADVGAGAQLVAYYKAGGVDTYVAVAPPFVDTEWHHYAMTYSQPTDELKLYVDGVQQGSTVSGLGVWAGGLSTLTVGSSIPGLTALGYYDEVSLCSVVRPVSAPTSVWTDRNYCHAYAGRDPANRGWNYRDEFWTPKYVGGDWFIRNDYQVEPTPVNVALADGEVVWRQTTKNLGDLGRLSRLLGLFLDRVADDRDHLIDAVGTVEGADDDYLPDLADRFGIKGLEAHPDWNVEQRRRWVREMRRVLKTGGIQTSYHRLSELLDYRLRIDTLYTRRWLDSVIDPARADVYLDQQGSLDTSDTRYPLAILRFSWYHQSLYSQTGAASVGDLLTDAGASFTTTARPGSLVRVYNPADPTNDGDYLVLVVVSDHVLLLDRAWPDPALADLHYSVNWHVPPPDPTALYLLDRANYIKPKVFRIEVL